MTKEKKQQLAEALRGKLERLNISQNEASRRIGVSAATISNILQGKWSNITGAWKKIEEFVFVKQQGWQTARTRNFNKIQKMCSHAQQVGFTRAISGDKGLGKSYALKHYSEHNENVFYVQAFGDMSKRDLLRKICKGMGIEPSYKLSEMKLDIIEKLNKLNNPLVIIDEFDELKTTAMRVYKDLYNYCKCGFVLVGGDHFKKRILSGVRLNKQSFKEIFSRLGGEFFGLYQIDENAVQKVCKANGITDKGLIDKIFLESNGDLRRVHAKVQEHYF